MTRFQADLRLFYARLNEFRKTGQYCDVNIHVQETSFRCHRVILAAACGYFDSMFKGNFRECSAEDVTLLGDGIVAGVFENVVTCMYTGEVEINDENAFDLLRTSDFLELNYIEDLCIHYIQENVPVRSAIEIFRYARATNKKTLADLLSRYIMEHFEEFSDSSAFFDISFDDLCVVLNHYVPSRNESLLAHTLIRWVKHASEERVHCFDELAKIVRFQNVSPKYTEFIFRRYIMDCASSSRIADSDALDIDSSYFKVFGKMSLHAYVEYLHKREDDSLTKVYSINDGDGINDWRSSSHVIHPGAYFLRNLAVDSYERLYCLDYRQPNEQHFRVFSSVRQQHCSAAKVLKSPPIVLHKFDLCGTRHRVYACNTSRVVEAANQRDHEFSAEEISRGIYRYERDLDKWFPVPEPKVKISRSCMTAVNDIGLVYLIGPDKNVQTYDERTSHWQEAAASNFVYIDAACCTHDGKIYVCGGERASKRVEVFDPVAGRWQVIESMNRGRSGHRLVFYGDRLCAMGNSFTDYSIETYDPLFRKWCTFSLPQDIIQKGNPDRRQWESSIVQDVIVHKPFGV